MLTTNALLDAAKRAHSMPSDYRLCRVLGATDNTLYNWRKGKSHPDETYSFKLAKLAGLDLAFVLISMAALRAPSDEIRATLLAAADDIARKNPAQTVDILSMQRGTPDRLEMPMNKGFQTMGQGAPEYTLEQVSAPTPATLAGLGILAAGAWISNRRARLLRASAAH
jgi:hypothetical protein